MSSSSKYVGPQLATTATPMKLGNEEPDTIYVKRTAVRAVLQNPITEQIVLIHVSKGNYFKLPGGGIEPGEDHAYALAREILEETGCKATTDITTCFAKCEEFRNDLHQMSFCYVATLVEDTGRLILTHQEMEEGLTHRWVSVEEAIKLMQDVKPTSDLGNFVKQRDIFFLEKFAARKDN